MHTMSEGDVSRKVNVRLAYCLYSIYRFKSYVYGLVDFIIIVLFLLFVFVFHNCVNLSWEKGTKSILKFYIAMYVLYVYVLFM